MAPARLPVPVFIALLAAALLSACSVMPREPLAHSSDFLPVYPVVQVAPQQATGAIYNGRQSESFFGRGRAFQVGDVITVLLDERYNSTRKSVGNLSRESSNDAFVPALGKVLSPILGTMNLAGAKINQKGGGDTVQDATLSGAVAVAVVEIMGNGNLVLRGEKQLALSEGSEVIQVAGIVRADDVAPNNTVQSRRLANAQITYRGTGDLAAAARAGWGTSGLMKLWPF